MAVGQPSGAAFADETNTASRDGPTVSLVSTGQVDDPLEDVLEHASAVGSPGGP
ncbi:hypothetical protein [Streptomyces sp. NPDC002133]|uniref:hypothetical protein n=1 Tax=Streptomyces sp. NPDC002133 TaxID=3154409 RepID=UPI00332CE66D